MQLAKLAEVAPQNTLESASSRILYQNVKHPFDQVPGRFSTGKSPL
jgi:hypothetical protein